MNKHKNYLIIDLEATCCKERTISREAMEICGVWIGCCVDFVGVDHVTR